MTVFASSSSTSSSVFSHIHDKSCFDYYKLGKPQLSHFGCVYTRRKKQFFGSILFNAKTFFFKWVKGSCFTKTAKEVHGD